MIHACFGVALRMTGDMVHRDLPLLEAQVTLMLDEVEPAGGRDG